MRREPDPNPDRLVYREPAGVAGVVHVLLVAAFVGFVVLGMRGSLAKAGTWSTFELVLMCGFLAMIAAVLLQNVMRYVIRIGTTIDRASAKATTSWGPLVPLFRKTWPLADFDHLRIGLATTHQGSRVSSMQYILTLAGPTGEVLIGRHGDYATIGDMAEEAALLLGFDVLDLTAQPQRWLRAAALKADRAAAAAGPTGGLHELAMSEPPAGSVVRRTIEKDRIVFAFPRDGDAGCLVIWVAALLGIAGFVAWYAIDWRSWTVMGGLLVAALVGLLMLLLFADSAAPVTVTLTVTERDLTIQRRRWYGTHRQRFPRSRIHDRKAVKAMMVLSAEGATHRVDHPLVSDAEMEWICLQLMCVLN